MAEERFCPYCGEKTDQNFCSKICEDSFYDESELNKEEEAVNIIGFSEELELLAKEEKKSKALL